MRWLLLGIVVTLQAASCGQKGPLYLPEDEQAAAHDALAVALPASAAPVAAALAERR